MPHKNPWQDAARAKKSSAMLATLDEMIASTGDNPFAIAQVRGVLTAVREFDAQQWRALAIVSGERPSKSGVSNQMVVAALLARLALCEARARMS